MVVEGRDIVFRFKVEKVGGGKEKIESLSSPFCTFGTVKLWGGNYLLKQSQRSMKEDSGYFRVATHEFLLYSGLHDPRLFFAIASNEPHLH